MSKTTLELQKVKQCTKKKMKQIFICVAIFFLNTIILCGQEEKLEVRVRLPDLVNALNFGLEYNPTARFGTELNIGVRVADSYVFSYLEDNGRETDFYTIIKGKFYLWPRHHADRIYFGVYGLYEHWKNENLAYRETLENRLVLGGLMGYKFVLMQDFVFDFALGTGFGKQLTTSQATTGAPVVSKELLKSYFLASFNLGFRF